MKARNHNFNINCTDILRKLNIADPILASESKLK